MTTTTPSSITPPATPGLILICAGGTGGHIIPGLAIAEQLSNHGYKVHWLGTRKGLEAEMIPKAKIPISFISINGLRGKGLRAWLQLPVNMLMAIYQSLKLIIKLQPRLVLGMGGFVAGPAGIAAWLLRKKLIIHEQNAIQGTTNKLLSKFANKILLGFPGSFNKLTNSNNNVSNNNHRNDNYNNNHNNNNGYSNKFIYTGNPVRPLLSSAVAPKIRFANKFFSAINSRITLNILVLGGSRGAKILNQGVPLAVKYCQKATPQIWHQTGNNNLVATQQMYQQCKLNAKLTPFIEDMRAAYEWADLVICRAGALTIAELAAIGVGSILVPFRLAVDNHQFYNAKYLVDHGAGVILSETDYTPQKLAELLDNFAQHPDQLLAMAQAAYKLATPYALDNVVKHCLEAL